MPPPAAGAPGGGGGGAGGVNDAFKDALQRARQVCACVRAAPSNQWGPGAWRPRSRSRGSSRLWGARAPPPVPVCWGSFVPAPRPLCAACPPWAARGLSPAPPSAASSAGLGPGGVGGEPKSRRASSGAVSAGPGREGGRQGGREGGGAELWPSCGARGARSPPGPVGLGSAAAAEPGRACGSSLSRRFYSELLHHGRCFHRFSGEMLALSVNKRSRFWQYLKTQCSRVLKLLGR